MASPSDSIMDKYNFHDDQLEFLDIYNHSVKPTSIGNFNGSYLESSSYFDGFNNNDHDHHHQEDTYHSSPTSTPIVGAKIELSCACDRPDGLPSPSITPVTRGGGGSGRGRLLVRRVAVYPYVLGEEQVW